MSRVTTRKSLDLDVKHLSLTSMSNWVMTALCKMTSSSGQWSQANLLDTKQNQVSWPNEMMMAERRIQVMTFRIQIGISLLCSPTWEGWKRGRGSEGVFKRRKPLLLSLRGTKCPLSKLHIKNACVWARSCQVKVSWNVFNIRFPSSDGVFETH